MRRSLVLVLVMTLCMGSFAAAEAAKKKKKKKPPKPVATTLYMHGQQTLGEIDGAMWLADGSPPESPMTVDGVEPEGSSSKSQAIGSPAFNSQCTGLPVGFPTFTGQLTGTISGDAKLIAYFNGSSGTAEARIWVDVGAFQACNDDYIEPHAMVEFEAASGEVEIPFTGVNIPAQATIMIEFVIPERSAPNPRLQYDSTDTLTRFEFGCFPPAGAKSCVPPPAEE
ncbi:MAG: hypothetical protein ACRDI3_06410 [Actinomycetota bacterium]